MPNDRDILTAAAKDALHAPSPLNTQPWAWRVTDDALELYADRERRLTVVDPHGKLVLLACGIALHHVRASLAAAGHAPVVQRFVSSFDDNLLARVTVGPQRPTDPAERGLGDAIRARRTDRRPFADRPVPERIIGALLTAAIAEGARLHLVETAQLPILAAAVAEAGEAEMADPAYRSELMRWTNRPVWSGDGVPADTTVQPEARRVAVRQLAADPEAGMPVDPGGDRGASYAVVVCDGDGPTDWFTAGEAASAVLLTATAHGLATAPITDVIEVARSRGIVTRLLPAGGHPFVVIRCGWSDSTALLADAPRRDPAETITLVAS